MPLSAIQKLRIKNVLANSGYGAVAGFCIGLLYYGNYNLELLDILSRSTLMGTMIGMTLSAAEEFIIQRNLDRQPFLILFLARAIIFTIGNTFWLGLVNTLTLQYDLDIDFSTALNYYIYEDTFQNDLFLSLGVSVVIIISIQISRLQSRGMLRNYILGRYHRPTEVERIFLFIDLKGSTTLGERLGNKKFSALLRDLFYDVTEGLLLSKGDVYSYVGDGMIVSWPLQQGLQNANCVQCFFHIENTLEKLRPRYLKRYGHFPQLKAGLHGGKAIVTWVGELKRQIVYHGDVLNTASRLEGECNRLEQSFLISGHLLDQLSLSANITATYEDELTLRGKQEAVRIYSLRRG